MGNDKIDIKIELSHVANRCLRQIRKTTTVVEYSYHAIINSESNSIPPLQVDGLPFRIDDPESDDEISAKEMSLEWIMKKAFEEFIVGLTESLIEAHRTVKLLTFANNTKVQNFTHEQIRQEIEKINQRPLSLPFPVLMDEIESELNLSLNLSEEIRSINNLRNCLVHDNGIVSEKRLNDKENRLLRLKYIELAVFAEREGQIIEVKLQDKNEGFKTQWISTQSRPRDVTFSLGEHVKINQNLFNSISYTCVQFVQGMFDAMPKKQVFN